MTPAQREVWEAKQAGESLNAIARRTGRARATVQELYAKAKRHAELDPGIQAAMEEAGLSDIAVVRGGWLKHKTASLQFTLTGGAQQSFLDSVREAVEGLTPALPIVRPTATDEDTLTLYPIADAHVGMMSWGKETGEDYDTDIACQRMREWVGRCVDMAPPSGTAVILGNGDLMHADDQTNQTPRSKHVLDVDTRFYRAISMVITALGATIEYAATKHEKVVVRMVPGNHDTHAYIAVLMALRERYRNDPRITIQDIPGEWFIHEFGQVLLAAHHGDKAKAERMVMYLADEYAGAWGRTRHRFLFTGHLHHHKSADIGGATWEQLRALTAKDAYAVSHAYSARAQMQAITYHRTDGEVQRVKING